MTRIAVLADIHGNAPALEAVIADVRRLAPDEVLVGGDLVGRGPQGSIVVQVISELGWRSVRGNHEDYLVTLRRQGVPEEGIDREHWAAARWMADELGERELGLIASLPFSLTSNRASEVHLVHGSPRSNSEGLGPWSTDQQLEDHLNAIGGGVLVCGHTHRPLQRQLRSGLVVNVGAVGLPFNRDRRSQYVVLHSDDEGWQVEFRRIDYDLKRILAVYESSGFLRAGGVTAQLLKLELEHAAPFLVPFLKWAAILEIAPTSSQVEAFLEFYDPGESIRDFFLRLERLIGG